MSDLVPLTIMLEPAIAELLGRIAEDAGSTPEAIAIESVTNSVLWVVTGGNEADSVGHENRLENEIENQLVLIQDTIDDFDSPLG
jgi:hypothetical protein